MLLKQVQSTTSERQSGGQNRAVLIVHMGSTIRIAERNICFRSTIVNPVLRCFISETFFKYCFVYLEELQTYMERNKERRRFYIHWFLLPMATAARTELRQSQEFRAFPIQVSYSAVSQALGLPTTAFQGALAGNSIENIAARTCVEL